MPELPEVETIARALREGGRGGPPVIGRTIAGARLLWPRTLAEPDFDSFLQRTAGQKIEAVGRRGKFLALSLTDGMLFIHLRMSGDVRVEPGGDQPLQPHDRLVIDFTDGYRLAFNDARKFGRAWLVTDPAGVTGKLGPEPLEESFTAEQLYRRLHAVNRQIKPLLLDQTFLAGMGNIYTDEALHAAGIHPLRSSRSVTPEEAGRLWQAIRAVLAEGIRSNGASFDWVYRGGDFQNNFAVYQRTGQPCPRCGSIIVRTAVGQRGTHYCPTCQPKG